MITLPAETLIIGLSLLGLAFLAVSACVYVIGYKAGDRDGAKAASRCIPALTAENERLRATLEDYRRGCLLREHELAQGPYIVLPTLALRHLPSMWQRRFTALLDEGAGYLGFNWPQGYTVVKRGAGGRAVADPWNKHFRDFLVDGQGGVHFDAALAEARLATNAKESAK